MNAGVTRTALVTGGSRGIGLTSCRQLARAGLRVVLTARDPRDGERAARELQGEGHDVRFEQLDVADPDSVAMCSERLAHDGVAVDVLVNNAATSIIAPVLLAEESELATSLTVNLFGAWRTCRAFVPGMRDREYGRVVNVSTGYAQMASRAPRGGVYGLSKAALNALTRQVAAEAGPWVKVNAMSPGWVSTRVREPGGRVTRTEATDTLVWLATLPDDGPTDGFFYQRRPVAW